MISDAAAEDSSATTTTVNPLDKRLIRTVTLALLLIAALIILCGFILWKKYDPAINASLVGHPPDHAAALSYERSMDAAIVKISALLLAFVVVFLGAMYVLRVQGSGGYEAGIDGGGWHGSLRTSSPGLVMVTLGLSIVAIAVLSNTQIYYVAPTYSGSAIQTAPAEMVQEAPAATPTLPLAPNGGQ